MAPVPVAVDVLGPLRLTVAGTVVDVRGPKRRAVLALLALAQGRVVTGDRLVDALWPDDPPESGRAALQSHVSRLRGHLGTAAARLETLAGGYRLALADDELDAARVRALVTRARTEPDALHLLHEARALWRGPALAGLTDVAPLAASATALDDLHREVTDRLVARAVETGRLDGAVDLAAESVAADPLREQAVVLLVRALAAAGQAPDALAAARAYRRRLAEETGLDAGPALGELERAVAAGATRTVPTRPAAPLIGRELDLAQVRDLLARERLVTLVGPGGVGKTRLARELAGETVLLLAPVTDPAAVPRALAAALQLQVVRGDVLTACVGHLAARPELLVVDNCEHLVDAARDVVGVLLDGCRTSPCSPPAGSRSGSPSRLPTGCHPWRWTGPGRRTRLRRSRCSWIGPRGSGPASPRTPATSRSSRTSCAGWTGCHWRSSWPPGGCRGSRSASCTPGSTARSTCSAAAGRAPTPGTGRCGTPSSGPTPCSATTSSGCSGTCRCSPTAWTSPRPRRSPPTWTWGATGVPRWRGSSTRP